MKFSRLFPALLSGRRATGIDPAEARPDSDLIGVHPAATACVSAPLSDAEWFHAVHTPQEAAQIIGEAHEQALVEDQLISQGLPLDGARVYTSGDDALVAAEQRAEAWVHQYDGIPLEEYLHIHQPPADEAAGPDVLEDDL